MGLLGGLEDDVDEGGDIAKRIKTARLRRKTKPGRDVILHVRP